MLNCKLIREIKMNSLPTIALGTWSWGTGAAGGDQVFGNNLNAENLKPVFDAAMKAGLGLWDTAAAYGMGSSETILGEFVKQYPRENVIISTKFTPQIASTSDNAIEELLNSSLERLGTNYIDIYWIHNPANVKKWTPGLIPLLKSGTVKRVGVSNHNLEEIKQANVILSGEGFKISAVQNHYSLLYRSSEEGRANTYNKALPQLEELTNTMKKIGESKNASIAQVAIAWAIAKHTLPIIGVTKVSQVEDAVQASKIWLTKAEIETIEALAKKAGVDARGSWEKPMIE